MVFPICLLGVWRNRDSVEKNLARSLAVSLGKARNQISPFTAETARKAKRLNHVFKLDTHSDCLVGY